MTKKHWLSFSYVQSHPYILFNLKLVIFQRPDSRIALELIIGKDNMSLYLDHILLGECYYWEESGTKWGRGCVIVSHVKPANVMMI